MPRKQLSRVLNLRWFAPKRTFLTPGRSGLRRKRVIRAQPSDVPQPSARCVGSPDEADCSQTGTMFYLSRAVVSFSFFYFVLPRELQLVIIRESVDAKKRRFFEARVKGLAAVTRLSSFGGSG